MRLVAGDINVYWQHDTLTPEQVRAASYGSQYDSGTLLPDVGDVVRDFHGFMGEPTTVKVVSVVEFGQGCTAYRVTVTDVTE